MTGGGGRAFGERDDAVARQRAKRSWLQGRRSSRVEEWPAVLPAGGSDGEQSPPQLSQSRLAKPRPLQGGLGLLGPILVQLQASEGNCCILHPLQNKLM